MPFHSSNGNGKPSESQEEQQQAPTSRLQERRSTAYTQTAAARRAGLGTRTSAVFTDTDPRRRRAGLGTRTSAVFTDTDTDSDTDTIIVITYNSGEEAGLLSKFGSSSSYDKVIQSFLDELILEMASTTMQIEYNFKKSKFPTLSEKNLSAFETDEAAQDIDIETTMVATTTKSGTSY